MMIFSDYVSSAVCFSLLFIIFQIIGMSVTLLFDHSAAGCVSVRDVSVTVKRIFLNFILLSGVILIKKAGDGSKKIKGCWDSIHVVEVQEKTTGRSAHYKLTSTAMLWLQTNKPGSGTMNLGGSLTRQVSTTIGIQEVLNLISS
jgi:hypothetical protein